MDEGDEMASHYKYQINFSGMIGFVPNEKHAFNEKPSKENGYSQTSYLVRQVMALIVDGKSPHRGPDKEDLFPHFPYIHYRLDDLSPNSRRKPDLMSRGYGITFLSLEELTIGEQDHDHPTLESRLDDEHKASEPTADYGPENLCWIMPIHRVGEVGGVSHGLSVDKNFLGENYEVGEGNRLAARAKLSQGRLYTRDFFRNDMVGDSLCMVCDFCYETEDNKCLTKHYSQMVSTFVTYEPAPQCGPLKIKSHRFKFSGNNKREKCPSLVFNEPKDNDIVINIWNAPLSHIMELMGAHNHDVPHPSRDRSFRSYFNLCKVTPPKKLPVLQLSERKAATYQKLAGTTDKHVACPTGRYPIMDF